jgi:hypothetical protein
MAQYTTKLQAGLGLIEETYRLLEIWEPGMNRQALIDKSMELGFFPNITARRLRNIISEAFAVRYLIDNALPANHLKLFINQLSSSDCKQLLFLFTCRVNPILRDFVIEVYWDRYRAGGRSLEKSDSLSFTRQAVTQGKTTTFWSESTITRISSYLLGACTDFDLLGPIIKGSRDIIPFVATPALVSYIAHDLHFRGLSDSEVQNNLDWGLFGLESNDIISEFRNMALRGEIIIQAAASLVQIAWKYSNMNEFNNALIK